MLAVAVCPVPVLSTTDQLKRKLYAENEAVVSNRKYCGHTVSDCRKSVQRSVWLTYTMFVF